MHGLVVKEGVKYITDVKAIIRQFPSLNKFFILRYACLKHLIHIMNLKKSASQQKTNVDAIYLSYLYTFNELSNFMIKTNI
jgi:hypothetical protein